MSNDTANDIFKREHKKISETKGGRYVIPMDEDGTAISIDTSELAKESKQLPDGHNVTVVNPTADPETGLAKDETLIDGSQVAKIKETSPTDATKSNASLVLTYTAGNLTKVTKTIGTTSYEKTLTWTDGALTAVSAWSAV